MPIATASAMPPLVVRQLLKLVRGPVTKIQRPRRTKLERVATRGNVLQVKLGASVDGPSHRRFIAADQRSQCSSMNEKNVASFSRETLTASERPPSHSRSGDFTSIAMSLMTANGGAKVPRKFFFAESVHAVLDANPGIILRSTVVGKCGQAEPLDGRWPRRTQPCRVVLPPPIAITNEWRSIPLALIARWISRQMCDRS